MGVFLFVQKQKSHRRMKENSYKRLLVVNIQVMLYTQCK